MREKVDYRAKLHDALDRNEKDLTDRRVDVMQVKRGDRTKDAALLGNRPARDAAVIETALVFRDRLLDLTDEIDRTLDQDWSNLKLRIDRELKDHDNAPKPGRT